jgi:MFS family permease
VALSIIVSTFPDAAERPRAIGVFQAVLGLSMACGPILGGVMLGAAGWRGIFWINVPVGLVALELAGRLVPESRAPRPRRPDLVGQVLVIVILGSLTSGIIEGPGYGWYSARISGCFALTVAALAVLLAYEPRRPDPMIDLRFFRSVPFAGASVAAICAFAAQSGFLFLSTLYLQDVRGFSPLDAGLHVVPMAAAMACCSLLAGRIVARGRTRAAMLIAGAALTLSCAALSRVSADFPAWELIGAYAMFGVGMGMVNAPITNAAVSGMPREQAGLAGGITSASRQVGQALGVAIAGSVLAARLRGSVHSGFVTASHTAWWVLAGFAYAVLLVGTFATSQWAKATAARGRRKDEGSRAAGPGRAAAGCDFVRDRGTGGSRLAPDACCRHRARWPLR